MPHRFLRPAAAGAILLLVSLAPPAGHAATESFQAWVAAVRVEAQANGISTATLDAAFDGLEPDPKVIELDRKQPETKWTFDRYLQLVIDDERIAKGRENYAKYRPLLRQIGAKYGVQPQVIVALWGIETKYGARTGTFDIIRSLATLAYDGRRSAFFRKELLAALQILNDGHISRQKLRGSWAGAMGQNQFMPTSFVAYAVDHSGDGRRDIWETEADVFASAANYLAKQGWVPGQRWGRPVSVPAGFDSKLADRKIIKRISEWKALGVEAATSGDDLMASVLLPDGPGGPAFLVYQNFRVIRRWNPSNYFALAVGLLADRVAGGS